MRNVRNSQGWGLLETLLTLGTVSALSLAVYMALSPTSSSAQTKREQDNLRDLSVAVERSFGLVGNFQSVSASRVLGDGLAPIRMVDGTALRTSWGSSVSVLPHSVRSPNDGFVVIYPATPPEVCSRLASAVARDVYDLRVNGTSVFAGGQLNVAGTTEACSQTDTASMEFVYHSGLVAGEAVAAPPLLLAPSTPSLAPPTAPPVGAPVGPVAPVGPAEPPSPVVAPPPPAAPPAAPSVPPAPTPVTVTPPPAPPAVPAPAPPIGTVNACVAPGPREAFENRALNCAAGHWGQISERRRGVYVYSCPEAWSGSVETFTGWEAWAVTGNTCTTCPAPSSQTETQWVGTGAPCPAGQTGTNTWEVQQSRTRSVSYNCPAGTTSLPGASFGGWSGWANTGATRNVVNTCTTPAPTYATSIHTACTKSFRSNNPDPAAKRIVGWFEVGSDNPSAYSVSWSGITPGDPACPSCGTPARPWTNPAHNQMVVDQQCSGSSEWGYRATATSLVTGQVFTSVFTCRCSNIGL